MRVTTLSPTRWWWGWRRNINPRSDAEPQVHAAAFKLEPQVKEESLTFHHGARPVKLLERKGPHVVARDDNGLRVDVGVEPMASETALGSHRGARSAFRIWS